MQSSVLGDLLAANRRMKSGQRDTNGAVTVQRVVLGGVIAFGVMLRTVQFAANPALWLDEIALSRSIITFDVPSLLTDPPLFSQVAPKGFLLAQKAAVLTLGPVDYALRLVPFVSSLIALFVFAAMAKRLLSFPGAFVATLLFATAAPFVMFAGTAKQYSTDVCVAVFLTSLALTLVTRPVSASKAWGAAIAGGVLVWFSQPAVLVIVAVTGPLIVWLRAESGHSRWRLVAIVVAVWGASALGATASALATMTAEGRDYVRLYWASGFMPSSLAALAESGWPWPNIRTLFGSGPGANAALGYSFAPLYPVLAVVGFGVLTAHHRQTAVILFAPIAVTLGAAIAGQYPFSDRLILFLLPSAMIAIAATVAVVSERLVRASKLGGQLMGAVALAMLTLPTVIPIARCPPPYRTEDVKPVLQHVAAQRRPGDKIYVYYGAAPAMQEYASAYGFQRNEYAVGNCHRGDTRRYFEELDKFRGTGRLWVIVTHSVYGEAEEIASYMNQIGVQLDHVRAESRSIATTPPHAEAFLYDVRGASGRAHPDSYTATRRFKVNPRFTCEGGLQQVVRSDFQ